jgi:outer membrane protein OmpA-like peptidoglycan-associated protein
MLKKLAVVSLGVLLGLQTTGCVTEDAYTGEKEISGATIGAVTGAVAGAVIGNQVKGDKATREKARLAGAALGAGFGGLIGDSMDKREAKIKEQLRSTGVSVVRKKTGGRDEIQLVMPGDITFEKGSSAINPSFQETLASVAIILKEYSDFSIMVNGHTDSTGKLEANNVLSQQRAEAVAVELQKGGVAEKRMSRKGFGPSQPVADNATESGRATNRRVELFMFKAK